MQPITPYAQKTGISPSYWAIVQNDALKQRRVINSFQGIITTGCNWVMLANLVGRAGSIPASPKGEK